MPRLTPEVRRRVMASIKSANTRPELMLRSALWAIGVRGWRCHVPDLPGRPDVVFPKQKVAVFVDGVWWHGHPAYLPRGRRGEYWDAKIASNVRRDREVDQRLSEMGWKVLRFWDQDILESPKRIAEAVHAALLEATVEERASK